MPDLARMPGKTATLPGRTYGRSWLAAGASVATYSGMDGKPNPKQHFPGVPSGIAAVDGFLTELADEAGVPAGSLRSGPGIASMCPGECELAADILEMALAEASLPVDTQGRRDARAWLQDKSAIYSARLCFEALGVEDYDALRKLLVQRWIRNAAKESSGGTA